MGNLPHNGVAVKQILTLAVLQVALLGCATPYQPKGLLGGFTESQLKTNVFSVYFGGNGFASRQRCYDFALLRCAEIALENGYPFFVITKSSHETDAVHHPHEGSTTLTHGILNVRVSSLGSLRETDSTEVYGAPVRKHGNRLTVTCFRETLKSGEAALDAAILRDHIRREYGLTEKRSTP